MLCATVATPAKDSSTLCESYEPLDAIGGLQGVGPEVFSLDLITHQDDARIAAEHFDRFADRLPRHLRSIRRPK